MSPRWLKLKEAAEHAAIGQHRLKDLARQGHIKGYQDPESKRGDWIFDRVSLDEYRERPLKGMVSPKEKALAIMNGIRL